MNMKIIMILFFYATGWGTTIYWRVPSSETTHDNEKWSINVNAHSFWAVVTMWHDNYKCLALASAAVGTWIQGNVAIGASVTHPWVCCVIVGIPCLPGGESGWRLDLPTAGYRPLVRHSNADTPLIPGSTNNNTTHSGKSYNVSLMPHQIGWSGANFDTPNYLPVYKVRTWLGFG